MKLGKQGLPKKGGMPIALSRPEDPSTHPMSSASRDQIQRAMMLASIAGQSFEDVKFFAFSRRNRTGRIDTPLPLLANSALIRKASPHFELGKSSKPPQFYRKAEG